MAGSRLVKRGAPTGGGGQSAAQLAFKGARAYRSAALSLANNSVVSIGFDAETYDTAGMHDNATNNTRLTVPTGFAGYWRLLGAIRWAANVTGGRTAALAVNGTIVTNFNFSPYDGTGPQSIEGTSAVADVLLLAVGDYVELQGFQSSGGSLALAVGSSVTFLTAEFIGT